MDLRDTRPVPTLRQLWNALVIAVLAATTILITAVLPAEYGIDPTGAGKLMGLTAMSSGSKQAEPVLPSTASPASQTQTTKASELEAIAILTQSDVPLRSDEMSLVLAPGKGAEIKASMEKGGRFVYEWSSGGVQVEFDMHGEPRNAKGDEFTSFLKNIQSADRGVFVAPFAGTHGWYWENVSKKPVAVRVKVSGFYEKLYKP